MERPWVYLDTSTYLKLFVLERGSGEARKAVQGTKVLSSAILPLESCSALARRKAAGEMNEHEFDAVLEHVRAGMSSIEIVRMTDDILKMAESVTLKTGARALDAIHIASALVFKDATSLELAFMTSDTKQGDAAGRAGLKTLFVE